MLKIKFVIDEKILMIKLISKYKSEAFDGVKNHLWEQYMDVYLLLQHEIFGHFENRNNKIYDEFFNKFKSFPIYKKLLQETVDYRNLLESNWLSKVDVINQYLNDILKIDFTKEIIDYVVHPYCHCGHKLNRHTDNEICYSHFNGIEDSNYDLAYLVHESLHCILPYQEDYSELEYSVLHAIIELINDEIYVKLSNGKNLTDGHKDLLPIKESLRENFNAYLNNKSMNIYDFIDESISYIEGQNIKK